jgi:hypothetical protein
MMARCNNLISEESSYLRLRLQLSERIGFFQHFKIQMYRLFVAIVPAAQDKCANRRNLRLEYIEQSSILVLSCSSYRCFQPSRACRL